MRLLTGVVSLLLAAPVFATVDEAPEFDHDAALSQSQAVLGDAIGNFSFRDTNGQAFHLDSLRGRPVVISLIYTSCHHVCPTITRNVRDTVEIAREALGEDSFSVVTIGFDWRVDTPDRMRVYRDQFRIDDDSWHFLSTDSATINALAENVGFQFFESSKGFDHLSQTTIIDAGGLIYRQIYGQDFEPPALVEPLKSLVFDTPADAGFVQHWVDTFKLFCTVYDPNAGRYRFDYSIFMMIIVGTLCLGAIATFILREWKHAV